MKYALAADGPSDKVLISIINWSLGQFGVQSIDANWVDFGRIPKQPDLRGRLRAALDLYSCDLLFVHRDAEKQSPSLRRSEILDALGTNINAHVPVIPVRMTEAWLLIDEQAIRSAADNPNGTDPLNLPEIRRLEALADPKQVLYDALKKACGLRAGRREKFPVRERVYQIPNYIDDFSPLRQLSAFRQLESDIQAALQTIAA